MCWIDTDCTDSTEGFWWDRHLACGYLGSPPETVPTFKTGRRQCGCGLGAANTESPGALES
jgi:hypothetical protein